MNYFNNRYKFFGLAVLLLILFGCTFATQTLVLSDNENPAIVEPSKDIDLLVIDDKIITIGPHNELGTKYDKVALTPGKHQVLAHVTLLGQGSKFLLDISVKGGRKYLVKYKIGDRKSYLSNIWYCSVWVEDAVSGEIVSSVIKNI